MTSDSKWKQTQAGGEKSREGKMGEHRSSWKPCAFSFSSLFFHCKVPLGVFVLVGDLVMCDAADQSCTAVSKPQWPQDCWRQGKKLCERYSSKSQHEIISGVSKEECHPLCYLPIMELAPGHLDRSCSTLSPIRVAVPLADPETAAGICPVLATESLS